LCRPKALRLPTASSLLSGDDRPAEMVCERAVRLRDLMEDVLEVARIDDGGERAEPREVELAALARRVVAACGPIDRRRRWPWRSSTPPCGRPTRAASTPRRRHRPPATHPLAHGEAEPLVRGDVWPAFEPVPVRLRRRPRERVGRHVAS
jgi:hypothetical protein